MRKVILITGASSGFGKLVAQKLLAEGHIVYAAARRLDAMKDIEKQGANIYKVDVTIEEDVKNLVSDIIFKEARIDCLINNAGYGGTGMLEAVSLEDAKRQFDVNVFGLASVTKEVLPYMRKNKSGTIINLSSVVGKAAFPMMSWYASSKHAVEGLSDSLRREIKPYGIKVVLIEPGAIKTEFLDVSLEQIKSVKHPSEYQSNVDNFLASFKDKYKKASGPDVVVNKIVKAVNSSNPKTRYVIGSDAKLSIVLSKILPTKLVDTIIRKVFNIK